MTEKKDNKRSGGIEPFKSRPDKDIENKDTAKPAKKINIDPVNKEELSALLSEPTGYADIVKQIRKNTISRSKTNQQKIDDHRSLQSVSKFCFLFRELFSLR